MSNDELKDFGFQKEKNPISNHITSVFLEFKSSTENNTQTHNWMNVDWFLDVPI